MRGVRLVLFFASYVALAWLLSRSPTSVVASGVMASGVAAPLPEETPNKTDLILELEMTESGGNLDAAPRTGGDVGIASHLDDVYTMPDYTTVPDLVPRVVISKGDGTLAEGYYFVTTFDITAQNSQSNSLMIVNDRAQLVYYQHHPSLRFFDFKRLPDGTATYFSEAAGGYQTIDSSYTVLDTWFPSAAYDIIDHHDFELLENGNVAFLIYDFQPLDLTPLGGQADAQVIDIVIQEMDPDHNVVFEWNSRDHFLITDTFVSLTSDVVDYSHANAIEEDHDGNFLISNRHMSEITKINRQTGEIIWRLGGKNNDFTFIGDTTLPNIGGFSYQHDIRRLPNGNITIFDNGNQFMDAAIRDSRGVEYAIDETNKTVTLVREFVTTPQTRSAFMGSVQRLSNGNTVVGWGGGPPPTGIQPVSVTEFNADGEVVLEFAFLDSAQLSYRGFKFPWQGFPTSDPVLVVTGNPLPHELRYSWNGATEVLSYTVLGGQTPQNLVSIAQQPKTDFEEATPLANVDGSLCFFQVVPSMAGNAVGRASSVVYRGDEECETGLLTDNAQNASRTFTFPQLSGVVSATVELLAGNFANPSVFVLTPEPLQAAGAPAGQVMSNVQFTVALFAGSDFSSVTNLPAGTQLTIEYGALDLSRSPGDVNLLRWDEATQRWTSDGLTLLERETVGQSATYALHRAGTYALFVANDTPQSAPLQLFMAEDEQISFSTAQIPFFDANGDDFAGVILETVPLSGSLLFNGTPITVSQFITAAALPQLVFAPAADEYGLPYASWRFAVSDGFTQSVPYSLTVLVSAVNDEPVAVDDELVFGGAPVTATANAAALFTIQVAVLANDRDVDGDELEIVAVTAPEHGTTEIAGDVIIYSASSSFEGTDSFGYTINDGNGGQASATVSLVRSPYLRYLPRVER